MRVTSPIDRSKMGPISLDNKHWKCIFGLHVRTFTIMIGTWHLMLNFAILLILVVLLRHPDMLTSEDRIELHYNGYSEEAPELPTPLSKIEERQVNIRLVEQRLDIGVMGCLCMMGITVFMISGATKGRPSRMLPFFCVQLFDLMMTIMTYLTYSVDLQKFIADSENLPFRDQLQQLNYAQLNLAMAVAFALNVVVKVYIISVVWRCHKYLTLRLHASQLPYVISDVGSGGASPGLGYNTLLPGYDEALAQSLKQQPPPSYQAAMSAEQQQMAGHVTVVLPPVGAAPAVGHNSTGESRNA